MKKKKQYIIFGLGRFGKSIALTLEENGISVCAADNSAEKLEEVSRFVTDAVRMDLRDADDYEMLGDTEYDGAVIAVGEDLEAATHAVMWASDRRIPVIIAKAGNEAYGRILKKLGADKLVFPEKETGMHIAMSVVNNNVLDTADISDGYTVCDVPVPSTWEGKTLRQLDLRVKYGVNVIGRKKMSVFEMNVGADDVLSRKDVLVILGRQTALDEIGELK